MTPPHADGGVIVVGVTGNLASGKSEVARIFKKHGAMIFDADKAARKAVQKGKPVYRAIVQIFGKGFLKKDQQLDRKKLAGHVFGRPKELKKLNTLVHPGVIFDCIRVIQETKAKTKILVLDVPLLFESRMQGLADVTLVVVASREKMLARSEKNGIPRSLARRIFSTQWPLSRKVRAADFVIENNGSLKDLEKKVNEIINQINKGR